MPVIDCHVHIFPDQAGACGYSSVAEHVGYQASTLGRFRKQPARGADGRLVPVSQDRLVINKIDHGSLRSTGFGSFAWTDAGSERSVQFLPPSLANNDYTAEALLAEMDFAGVDRAILQNDRFYGDLSMYFSDAVKRFPDRLIGLAQIDELTANRPETRRSLEHQICDLGMKGLYYSSAVFDPDSPGYGDERFSEFWNWVSRKGFPVWFLLITPLNISDHFTALRRFIRFSERNEGITFVLVHGLPMERYAFDEAGLQWPQEVIEMSALPNLFYEVTHPINIGDNDCYPYHSGASLVKGLVDLVGHDKVLWGSDMPASNLYCTYRQTRSFLGKEPSPLLDEELLAITGGNAARILNLDTAN